jgi:hypothetical protein
MTIFGGKGCLQIIRGNTAPKQGWFSPESGCRIPIDTVCFSSRVKLPTWIGTLIQTHSENRFLVNIPTASASDELWPLFTLTNSSEIFEFSSKFKTTKQATRSHGIQAPFALKKCDQHGKELLFETK